MATKLAMFDTDECAEFLHMSPATLRYWRHIGDKGPKSFTIGRKVFYRQQDVDAWVEEQYANSNKGGLAVA